jgi:hypothetical protein
MWIKEKRGGGGVGDSGELDRGIYFPESNISVIFVQTFRAKVGMVIKKGHTIYTWCLLFLWTLDLLLDATENINYIYYQLIVPKVE